MQTQYALILPFKLEKISALVIRSMKHQSPKLKISVLKFLEKVIHTKASYHNKKNDVLIFLETIKKDLFGLMSNANKQVRDAFFAFKEFLIKQKLMDDLPLKEKPKHKRNMSRITKHKNLNIKRTMSSVRNIEMGRKKGTSVSKRYLIQARTRLMESDISGYKSKKAQEKLNNLLNANPKKKSIFYIKCLIKSTTKKKKKTSTKKKQYNTTRITCKKKNQNRLFKG